MAARPGRGPDERDTLAAVLGERQAIVIEAATFDIHGVEHVDVTVVYPDQVLETARLGRESTPVDLRSGEVVMVAKAMNMIVSIGRP